MNTFFTADCHFGHYNIIRFCERPFKNLNHMHGTLISNWNKKVKPEDTVYHVGDFSFGWSRKYESRLNGKIIHIRGNHDWSNGTKSRMKYAVMDIFGLMVYVTHVPPVIDQERTVEYDLVHICDFILCAHVHNLWKHKFIGDKPAINIGVDVWGFEPVSLPSLFKYLKQIGR